MAPAGVWRMRWRLPVGKALPLQQVCGENRPFFGSSSSSNFDPISNGHLLMKNLKTIWFLPLGCSSHPISDAHLSDPGFGEARTITFSSTAPSKLTSPTMEPQYQGSTFRLTKNIPHVIVNFDNRSNIVPKFASKSMTIDHHEKTLCSPVDLEQWRNGYQLNGCVRVSFSYAHQSAGKKTKTKTTKKTKKLVSTKQLREGKIVLCSSVCLDKYKK